MVTEKKEVTKTSTGIRLNVYLAHSGLCSRRAADDLIKTGQITINHAIEKNPAYHVVEKDTVRYGKKVISLATQTKNITIAVNKPAGCVATLSDEKKRATIMDLLDRKITQRLYPIGRLDIQTTGIILMTNDGVLAHTLAHPKFSIQKIYQVALDKPLTSLDFEKIKKGIRLIDGPIKVDTLAYGSQKTMVRVGIHSGKNRIVRRIFESFGYNVLKLDRVSFAGISKRGLSVGHYRFLTPEETEKLQKLISEKSENKKMVTKKVT